MNRYTRQVSVVGLDGQKLISASSVLVVGTGGIGSPVLTYLAAAGVGTLLLVDKDKVELSNLHRQIIFNEQDLGLSKAMQAQKYLKEINSTIHIEAYNSEFNSELACQLIPRVDLVIDGTDNYKTRYLINDVCVLKKKHFISCSILKDIVQLVLFNTTKICYRCIYPEAPPAGMIPNCEDAGVLGTVTGIAGTMTAHLAIHYLLQSELCAEPILRVFDAKEMSLDSLPLRPNEQCTACKNPNHYVKPDMDFGVSLEDIDRNDYFLVDIRDASERELFKLDDDLFFPIKEHLNIDFFLNYKEKKILIYCAKGYRSKIFAEELRAKGVAAYYLKQSISPL